MKKEMVVILTALLFLLSACGETQTPSATETTPTEPVLTMADINSEDTFVLEAEFLATYKGEVGTDGVYYRAAQGSCTDGEYIYLMMMNGKTNNNSVCKIRLDDLSLVEQVYDPPIDHGNDAAYIPGKKLVAIASCYPNPGKINLMDPETLEVVDVTYPGGGMIYCISYHPGRDQYLIGYESQSSSSTRFGILDGNFENAVYHTMHFREIVGTTQGSDCDDNFLYFPQWNSVTGRNFVVVYNWDGTYINTIEVLTDTPMEIESMFHVGDDVYIAFNYGGAHLYKATLKKLPQTDTELP